MINTNSDILNYLNAPITDEEHEIRRACLDKVSEISSDLSSVSQQRWREFSLRRLMASNSLSAGQEVASWDEANRYVHEMISKGRGPSIIELAQINSIFNPEESAQLRQSFSFGGEKEFLLPEDLDFFMGKFSSQVLNNDDLQKWPLWKAFLIYSWGISIHPYSNGNGRTFRLASDWILLQAGHLPLLFHSHVQAQVAVARNVVLPHRADVFRSFLAGMINTHVFLFGKEA